MDTTTGKNIIEDQRNLLQQNLIDRKVNPHNQSLLKQINQWEKDAIIKIQRTAQEAIDLITKHTNRFLHEIEIEPEELTKQLKDIRQENEFNEIILNQLKQTLERIEDELKNPPPTISIEEEDSSSTFSCPLGLDVDIDETIYVADYYNNRIVRWEKNVKQGCIVVDQENKQLFRSVNVIYNRTNNCLIITDLDNKQVLQWCCQNRTFQETIASNIDCSGLTMDHQRHEVKRYKIGKKEETIVAGGNGRGDCLNQLDTLDYIYVDQQQSLCIRLS